MYEVEPGVYYTEDYPGPSIGAVVMPRGILFIDAPLRPEDGVIWKSTLLNRSRGVIHKLLVYLDSHPDRTIGAKAMLCPAIAQRKAAERLSEHGAIFRGQLPESGSEWEKYPETDGLRWSPPDMTYTKRIKFHWGEPTTWLEHHPGPCPGSSWVIVPDRKVVFVGDTALYNAPPFLAYANLPKWLESLEELTGPDFKDFTIISGRGGSVPQPVLEKQYKILKKLLKRIEKLAKKNAPPEAVADLASVILEDFSPEEGEEESHLQRLRHGLYQYYMKHYVSEA